MLKFRKNPNLEYRMSAAPNPGVNDSVMVQVTSVDDEGGANCILLEYGNKAGQIERNESEVRKIQLRVGAIEPVMVVGVGPLLLNRDIDVHAKFLREKEYNRNKYVHQILLKVAKSLSCDLKNIYEVSGRPSYEDLTTNVSDCLKNLPKKLSDSLAATLQKFLNETWRLIDPSILRLGPIIVPRGVFICWAIALVRQFEAALKLKGLIDRDIYLSIQDLYNNTRTQYSERFSKSGDLDDLEYGCLVLRNQGIVSEEHCPLTGLRARPNVYGDNVAVFSLRSFDVHHDYDFTPDIWLNMLKDRARQGPPPAVSVLWFRSFKGKKDVYKPTDEEYQESIATNCSDLPTHVMLLTGQVTHEDGTLLWELQDDGDDVGNGDRGFLYFAQYPNSIIEIVDMQV